MTISATTELKSRMQVEIQLTKWRSKSNYGYLKDWSRKHKETEWEKGVEKTPQYQDGINSFPPRDNMRTEANQESSHNSGQRHIDGRLIGHRQNASPYGVIG